MIQKNQNNQSHRNAIPGQENGIHCRDFSTNIQNLKRCGKSENSRGRKGKISLPRDWIF